MPNVSEFKLVEETVMTLAHAGADTRIGREAALAAAKLADEARAALSPGMKINWDEAVRAIQGQGEKPEVAFARAAKESKVVGLGEIHVKRVFNDQTYEVTGPEGQIRDHTTRMMPLLADSGISHLGVEVPVATKSIFDAFNAGKDLEYPAHLPEDPNGKILEGFKWTVYKNDDLVQSWLAARANNIKLVPIDVNHAMTDVEREKLINRNLMDIVRHEDTKKLFAWLGNNHMADSHGTDVERRVAELLRMDLKGTREKLTTFASTVDLDNDPSARRMLTNSLTHIVGEATSFPTRGLSGIRTPIGSLPWMRTPLSDDLKFAYQPFDNVIVHKSPFSEQVLPETITSRIETQVQPIYGQGIFVQSGK